MTTNFDYYEDGDVLTGGELNNQISRSLHVALQSAFQLNVELSSYVEGATEMDANDNCVIQNFVSADPLISTQRAERNASYYMVGEDTSTIYYMIVTASSCTRADGYSSNGVTINQLSSTQWVLYAAAATVEESRSTLLYYTGIDNSAVFLGTIFSGVTAVEISDSREVGKTLNWIRFAVTYNASSTGYHKLTVTPSATTGNNDVHSNWKCVEGNPAGVMRWEVPTGNIIGGNFTGTDDQRTSDTSADDDNNPTTMQMYGTGSSIGGGSGVHSSEIVISSLACTFTEDYTGNNTPSTNEYGNLVDDYSFPLFTAVTTSFDPDTFVIETGFTSTVTAEGVWNDYAAKVDSGASIVLEASADGTNYETVTKGEFKKLANLGTTIRFRMTVTKSSSSDTTTRVYGMSCGI